MRARTKQSRGFTLVEMAIVLVIIGIILAGVMKGRDIIRGAQLKQFSQGYGQKWVTIATAYFDKTGQHLCDGAVNGGGAALSSDGLMDGVQLGGVGVATATQNTVLGVLKAVGVDPCALIKSDLENLTVANNCAKNLNPFERTVDGEFSGRVNVGLAVNAFTVTMNGIASKRNCVVLVDLPLDIAIGMDTVIDGQARGDNGAVVNAAVAASATQDGVSTAAWVNGDSNGDAITAQPWPTFTDALQFVDVVIVMDN
jgi:prepilin-type N-terminal cleavage/methylation domain-containing protein